MKNLEWLTCKEASAYLRITENALRIMVHRGKLKAYKIGRRLRFQLKDCEDLFKLKGVPNGNQFV
jgi:excisionase family DNA binding protein